jgi:hypothetical protein
LLSAAGCSDLSEESSAAAAIEQQLHLADPEPSLCHTIAAPAAPLRTQHSKAQHIKSETST